MYLVGNLAGRGFLPVAWLTLARSSLTTRVPPRVCRVAIFWKAPGESMAGNTGELFRTSEPFTQRSRSYCPFTDPTLQPNESKLVGWMYSSHRVGFMQECGCGFLEFLLLRTWWRTRMAVSVYAPLPCSSPDVSTARRVPVASSPLPPLPDCRS